ncbi:MAG: peptidylprolyl isomerase [Caulobacteraceae bacterium]
MAPAAALLVAALLAAAPAGASAQAAQAQASAGASSSMDQVLAASPASDWRAIDPANTLYLRLATGVVVIELAPAFAPNHVANIKALVRGGYFDGLAIVRVQDNYVVQWADPDGKRPVGAARRTLKAEFERPYDGGPPFTPLPDPDTYAPLTGFSDGFPAARDPRTHETWLTHCYGMVGAGRDTGADSGGGTELYAVIGNGLRQLDRNVTLVGRVVKGMELLSALPRGTEALGFYATPAERIPIVSVRLAADLPPAERRPLQALREDSPTFAALLRNRRFRQDAWYKVPAGRLDVCNMPLPVRAAPK